MEANEIHENLMKVISMHQYLAALLIFASFSLHAETKLDCGSDESKNIAKFSTKAKRLTAHILQVSTAHTKLIFKDKPPYDEELAGTKWQYCGYSTALKMHLVRKDEDVTFSGVLIEDATAKQLPAGEDVIFTDDGLLYTAFVQPDGLDGREMSIYQRDGTLLWQGYDFIEGEKNQIAAYFDESYIHWNSKRNQLQATAMCYPNKKAGLVTLTRQDNGKWVWLPKVNCQP